MFAMFCSFFVFLFFLIFRIIFLICKISDPFSLVEAKADIFNIHIGSTFQKYLLQTKFSYFSFSLNHCYVLH